MFKLKLKCFKWIKDESGDIGITLFGIVTLLKYKEMTIIYWFKKFEPAGRWQGKE